MVGEVELRRHRRPLGLAALAAQSNEVSLYCKGLLVDNNEC